jgi:hypothetical protein
LVTFMLAAVVLDMLRMVCLGRTEETALRKVLEKASVTAKRATSTVRAFEVRKDEDGGVGCCCVVVSDIEREIFFKGEVSRSSYTR